MSKKDSDYFFTGVYEGSRHSCWEFIRHTESGVKPEKVEKTLWCYQRIAYKVGTRCYRCQWEKRPHLSAMSLHNTTVTKIVFYSHYLQPSYLSFHIQMGFNAGNIVVPLSDMFSFFTFLTWPAVNITTNKIDTWRVRYRLSLTYVTTTVHYVTSAAERTLTHSYRYKRVP